MGDGFKDSSRNPPIPPKIDYIKSFSVLLYGYMSKPKQDSSIQIPDNILRELLTFSEIRMLKNRFRIMNLLKDGLSIRKIASQVKVGTDTVVRVARVIEKGNLKAFKKVKELHVKTSAPWIFGKSE